ncbi:hypothetical protein AVEN_145816-1 [Araneus ventricosus]|uniref:EGF-like domain-containing protein n=1 Tax=Araneus ventricosus TaxID=182803 RepID=A0A4Y2V0I0_ARAVE|nr:hypothetical protein AVEN_145816-1 [Araneus ventricosus]
MESCLNLALSSPEAEPLRPSHQDLGVAFEEFRFPLLSVPECNCGANARSCFFRDYGIKVCNCDFGYNQTNGYCSAICNEANCIHGKCETVGNGFKCRCNEGFTGQRCEEKVQTKLNKQDLWMVLLLLEDSYFAFASL